MGQMIGTTRRPDTAVYRGIPGSRAADIKAVVTVDGEALPLRRDLAKLSDRFTWGYWGGGPGQLTLAILTDAIGEEAAMKAWERFHLEFIGQLQQDEPFAFTAGEVRTFVRERESSPLFWSVPQNPTEKKSWWQSIRQFWKKPA